MKSLELSVWGYKYLSREVHVALTGHRPNKLWGYDLDNPEYERLQDKLESIVEQLLKGYNTVICHSGLALGADSVWSIAILNMREKYPNRVFFHAEIPFMGQAGRWSLGSQDLWEYQVETSDFKTVYLTKEEGTSWDRVPKYQITKALDDRNKGMVDACDVLIGISNGSNSGTKNALDYAESKGVKVLTYHPKDFII